LPETTSKKIIKNTIFNTAGLFWSYLLSFALTPYIIHKIGVERFGIWAITNTAINFFIFFDFGIGSSFVKHIAEYNTKRDYKTVNKVINTGIVFSLLFCIGIFIIFLFLKSYIIGLLKFSPELLEDVLFTFSGILIVFIINYAFTVFKSTLYGLQRMDIINVVFVIVSIPGTIGLILFLNHGYGLKGYVYNSILVALVTVISYAICAYRIFPQMAIHPRYCNMEMFKKLWRFGFKVQIAGFSEFINRQLDKVLLGYFLNVRIVAFYELGSKMALTAGSLPSVLLQAIEPASSELDAAKETKVLNKLYSRGTKYIVFLTFPLSLFVITNALPIMHFWMGESGYEKSALAIQILTIGYSFLLVNSVGRLMARGMGVPQFEMVSALVILGLNISLSITLIILFGFIGALIGTSVSAVIGSLYFMNRFHKHIKRTIKSFLIGVYMKPFFACVIAILTSFTIDFLFHFLAFSPSGRTGYLIYLSLKGIIFSGTYLLFIFTVKYLDEYDKEVFLSAIKFPLSKFGFIKSSDG
jgi:O-antigen/teichoic acid export membrane protein